jgi:predicted nucleotidyltransferase
MNDLQSNLVDLCRRYGVASLYAFGSRASEVRELLRNEREEPESTSSDLDIAVMPGAGVDFGARARVRLSTEIEDLLRVPRVDLVVLSEANPFLAADAVRGELLYCDDPDRQAHEELYVLRRAGDLAHFEEERMAGILSGELRR